MSAPDPDPDPTSLVPRLTGPEAISGVDDAVVSDHPSRRKLEARDRADNGHTSRNGGAAPGASHIAPADRSENGGRNGGQTNVASGLKSGCSDQSETGVAHRQLGCKV